MSDTHPESNVHVTFGLKTDFKSFLARQQSRPILQQIPHNRPFPLHLGLLISISTNLAEAVSESDPVAAERIVGRRVAWASVKPIFTLAK